MPLLGGGGTVPLNQHRAEVALPTDHTLHDSILVFSGGQLDFDVDRREVSDLLLLMVWDVSTEG